MTLAAARLVGVDVARCLALLGMVAAHLGTELDPDAPGGVSVLHQVVAGRSSALFAVLAGLSLVLATRRTIADHGLATARVQVAVRAVLIFGIGLVLGTFPSGVAVILTIYGLLFLCALPVLGWSARALAVSAALVAVASPVLSHVLLPHLPPTTYQVPWLGSLVHPVQLLAELLVTGYYPVLTWTTYLLAGMALGRLDLRRTALASRLLVGGTLLAVAALVTGRLATSSPSVRDRLVASYDGIEQVDSWADLDQVLRAGLHGTAPTGSPWWLAVWSPHSGSVIDLVHTTAAAVAVIGACLLLVHATGPARRRTWQVAFGAGAMTLTLYTAHVLVLALPDSVPFSHSLPTHVIVLLLIGALTSLTGARAPLERAVGQVSAAVSLALTDRGRTPSKGTRPRS